MSIFGVPSDKMDQHFVIIDKEVEPHRYLETILLFMSLNQAEALCNHIKNILEGSNQFVAFALHTGKRKKGNPVIGDDVY